MKKIIVSENIVKSFGEGDEKRNVLDGVSVDINQGEFVAVMGPSGSGKSTLLFALSGMDGVDSGNVVFDGVDLSRLKRQRAGRYAPDKNGLCLPTADLAEKPEHPRQHHPAIHAQWQQKWRAAHRKSQNADGKNRHCRAGKPRHHPGFGRATPAGWNLPRLMSDPKIIFGDEPTGALNSTSANEIMALLAEIHRQAARPSCWSHTMSEWPPKPSGCCSFSTAKSPGIPARRVR
jgi:putative ABC transport system ATP-binding protein